MDFFKKILAWGKAQQQKPQTHVVIGIVGVIMIGVGVDNMLLGIGLGIALGVPAYVSKRKNNKIGKVDVNKSKK